MSLPRTRSAGLSKLIAAFAIAAVALLAAAPVVGADDDPNFDSRNGDRFGKRGLIIHDRFNLKNGDDPDLDGREPDRVSNGEKWVVEHGTWEVASRRRRGFVLETSPEDLSVATDKRANIDALTANVRVTAKIRLDRDPDTTQYTGVSARFASSGRDPVSGEPVSDWVSAWFDPIGWDGSVLGGCPHDAARCGAIVLGVRTVLVDEQGEFLLDANGHIRMLFGEQGRARLNWRDGSSKKLTLQVVGDRVTVTVGGRVRLVRELESLTDATDVGIMSKGAGENRIEDFQVTGRERIKASRVDRSEKWRDKKNRS